MPRLKGNLKISSGSLIITGSGGTTTIGTGSNSITGSFGVSGSIIVSGSVYISSSNTFYNEGPADFVGNIRLGSGGVSSVNFPLANIVGAFAHGTGNTASGEFSHAQGFKTQATGLYSHAEGEITTASGYGAHAEGQNTIASGYASHAEGEDTIALGVFSHAEGSDTIARGSYSHAEGDYTITSGSYSHAEGSFTITLGYASHAEGRQTTSSGVWSHAEGHLTVTSGSYSHAEGSETLAKGEFSHAEGRRTTASGYASHAEGWATVASGYVSHAEGWATVASGGYSHAEGDGTLAIDKYSHAEGAFTTAFGNYSHAEGLGTIASGSYQHTQGKYNLTSSVEAAFIIGNGTDGNTRSNLVHAAGTNFEITGSLRVTGSAFIRNLSNTAQTNVVTYNTTTGQLFYTASNAIGGTVQNIYSSSFVTQSYTSSYIINNYYSSSVSNSGSSTPAAPEYGIQYNNGNNFAASSNFLYIHTLESLQQGNNTLVSGQYSHAEGSNSEAQGDYSHAEGSGVAAGVLSHAEGEATYTVGTGSHAEGAGATANGDHSHAEGVNTNTSGVGSHAEGLGTITLGSYSHAEGNTTRAVGESSHAEGRYTTSSGNYSHAEGNSNESKGAYSHAEGRDTIALGGSSHAEGILTVASGTYSHAEGDQTIARGSAAHAEGYGTIAIGDNSHAEGLYTVASGSYQHVTGQYNVASISQSAFIIGDGVSGSNHNLLFASKSHFEVSASNVYFQGLPSSSQSNVLVIDTSNGQIYYSSTADLITPINNNVSASGTSSLSTTTILEYGLNVVEYADFNDYAMKLPTPIEGRSVTVINSTDYPLILYPSVSSGSINGNIGLGAEIPPDNRQYTFTCYENPLPGAWTWDPPATGQYDSGEMTQNIVNTNQLIQGFGDQVGQSNIMTSSFASSGWGYVGVSVNYGSTLTPNVAPYFRPPSQAFIITKVKVYTNIYATASNGDGNDVQFDIREGATKASYPQGQPPTFGSAIQIGWQSATSLGSGSFPTYLNAEVPSTSSDTGSIAPSIGYPGTLYKIIDLTTDPVASNPMVLPGVPGVTSNLNGVVGEYFVGTSASNDWYFGRGISLVLDPITAGLTGSISYRVFLERYFL